MRFRCIAVTIFSIALTSAVIGPQTMESQTSTPPPQSPAAMMSVNSYVAGNIAGFKRVVTRTVSGDRETITETIQTPESDGKFATLAKFTTETVGVGSDHVKSTRDAFSKDAEGVLQLIERTDVERETLQNGASRMTENSWTTDVNGRLGLSYKRVQDTTATAPNVKQTQTILYLPGINESLTDSERTNQTDQQQGPGLIQTDLKHDVRDANGGWQTVETSQEVRTTRPTEVIEDKTVRRLDGNGRLALSERRVAQRSHKDGLDQTVTETFSTEILGVAAGPGTPPQLDRRVRVTVSTAADGSSQSVTETEARVPGVTNGPLQIVARTIETTRQTGPKEWETQTQTFSLDGNGRLTPSAGQKVQIE